MRPVDRDADAQSLLSLLNARQLGLKLMAVRTIAARIDS